MEQESAPAGTDAAVSGDAVDRTTDGSLRVERVVKDDGRALLLFGWDDPA